MAQCLYPTYRNSLFWRRDQGKIQDLDDVDNVYIIRVVNDVKRWMGIA
jgi:hypothetical protein